MNVPTHPRLSRWLAVIAALTIAVGSSLTFPASTSAAPGGVERQAGANRFATAVAISKATFPTPGVPVVYVATGTGFADALAAGASAAKRGGPLLLVHPGSVPPETKAELQRLDPAVIVVAGGTAAVSPAVEAELKQFAGTVRREAGPNRYATAAQIATANFGAGTDVVYVATGDNFPDALAAGPAAAQGSGAVLLVRGNGLPSETASALRALNPDRIVIAGGTSVVAPVVENQLKAYGPVTRQAGANRFATAATISARSFGTGVPVVYIATGTNFPDALAAGPAAAAAGGPVLLVRQGDVPAETAAEIRRLKPTRIIIAGGGATVSSTTSFYLSRLNLKPTGPTQTGTVTNVVDGDTIDVNIGGTIHRVRYIGIDTPEIHSGVEWLGPEAADANAALVAGKQVILEKDVSETDQYGRLLRYVWVSSGGGWVLVNLELLLKGLATVTTYPPDVKYVDSLYLPAQRIAQAAGRGLWGSPDPEPPPPPPGCDPAYPSVCIPPPPPDLDCPDITYRNFTVRAPDPHGFDGDNDGIGCET